MRSILYNILYFFSPLYNILGKNRLRVLAYHTVPEVNRMEEQLLYLKSKYSIINIEQLKGHLYKGEKLPANPLLITFDDGDISVLKYGLPLLKRNNVPAALFVITELINSSQAFWCRRVEKVLQKEGKTYLEARRKVNQLKQVTEADRKEYLRNLEDVKSQQLTTSDLKELCRGSIAICNHTHSHPMFNRCKEQEIRNELEMTKIMFDEWDLCGYSYFAYPNGNWDSRSENILKEVGIELAFLFDHRLNAKKIDPFRISRIRVDADTEFNEFKVKVSGLHPFLMNLKEKYL